MTVSIDACTIKLVDDNIIIIHFICVVLSVNSKTLYKCIKIAKSVQSQLEINKNVALRSG